MKHNSIKVQIQTSATASHVFQCIREVDNWWSADFTGSGKQLLDEFVINHPGRHYSKQRVVEMEPDKRISWEVVESHLDWLELDKKEWTGTKMHFRIAAKEGNTTLYFEHEGIGSEKQCFARCSEGWQMIIREKLLVYMEQGKGHDRKERLGQADFRLSFDIKASPGLVLDKIAKVGQWWAKDFTGSAENPGDRFVVRFGTTYVNFTVCEYIPAKKVCWMVTDCNLDWIDQKKEWTGTKVSFELSEQHDRTTIVFTHFGLTDAATCYTDCKKGWTHHLLDSLVPFVEENRGIPE